MPDKKISAAADIVPLLEKLVQVGKREILIIAEDVDGEALATLVLNKITRYAQRYRCQKRLDLSDRRKGYAARYCNSDWCRCHL